MRPMLAQCLLSFWPIIQAHCYRKKQQIAWPSITAHHIGYQLGFSAPPSECLPIHQLLLVTLFIWGYTGLRNTRNKYRHEISRVLSYKHFALLQGSQPQRWLQPLALNLKPIPVRHPFLLLVSLGLLLTVLLLTAAWQLKAVIQLPAQHLLNQVARLTERKFASCTNQIQEWWREKAKLLFAVSQLIEIAFSNSDCSNSNLKVSLEENKLQLINSKLIVTNQLTVFMFTNGVHVN
jgi:hypothetical protein